MKYTADSWFFIQLSEGNQKAVRIWQEILDGKGRIVIPATVIVEIKRRFLKRNLGHFVEELLDEFYKSTKVFNVDLTVDLASKAGGLGFTYNIPPFDSVVLATAIETGFINVITGDKHFIPAHKEGKINMVCF